MLTHWIALGLIAGASGGDGGYSETGTVTAPADCTAVLLSVQSSSAGEATAPRGAVPFRRPYDPADHAPYAIDFTAFLKPGEKIAEIVELRMNATAALLSVAIDDADDFNPIIDTAGKKLQVWFAVDEAQWAAASFGAGGVQLPVTARILTDAVPPSRWERTVILTVRQL
jgi:hypothetical protein